MHAGLAAKAQQFPDLRIVALAFGQPRCEFVDDVTQPMRLLVARDLARNAARILDVLVAVEKIAIVVGSGPTGFHKWTEKITESLLGLSSNTASVGVLERMPPSQ
jgi:hypothetical protein